MKREGFVAILSLVVALSASAARAAELLAVQAVIARQLLPCHLRHGIAAAERSQPGEVFHAAAAAGGDGSRAVLLGGSQGEGRAHPDHVKFIWQIFDVVALTSRSRR